MDLDINTVPMVRLTWVDAQEGCVGWTDLEEMQSSPLAECQEVGWLLVNNDEKVVIMRSWNQAGQDGGACIAIPNTWVLNIEVLVPVDDVKDLIEDDESMVADWIGDD